MHKTSAGILLFRCHGISIEVLIGHPGGPFFSNKDAGAWSIPKGETDEGEPLEETARREFREEMGFEARGPMLPLGEVRMKSGKIVHAWAIDGTGGGIDLAQFKSNTFQMEWPPQSGRMAEFPEVDRAEFVSLEVAREKLNPALVPLLERLEKTVAQR
jgi:predicted NUDIX family NTP pyrophosphohydrolase